jgi:hypothetical protein
MVFMKMDKSTIAFILMVIILWINPELIYNLNKSFIGKLIILIIIVFFSSTNIILGLLTTFIYFVILDKYRYVIEGMISEDKITTNNTIGEIKKNDKMKNNEMKNNEMKNSEIKNNKMKNSEMKNSEMIKQNIKDSEEKEKNKNKIIISTSNNSNGVDIQDIRDSIASKDSNSFPLSKKMFKSTDDVEPFNSR